jgi:hypothetical protein
MGTLVCTDEASKQWYVEAIPERQMDIGPNHTEFVLYAADPIWKSVTPGTIIGTLTSSPGTVTCTPDGNKAALPVFQIKPTSSKGTLFAYKRFITAYNQTSDRGNFGYYPLNMTDDGTGDGFLAGTTLTRGTANYVMINVGTGINASQTTIAYDGLTGTFPAAGLAMIENEQILYSGTAGGTITVTTRGAHATTAGTHANNTPIYVSKIQADGDDIRMYVDGREVNRWFGGTVDSGTLNSWSNIYFPPDYAPTVLTAIGTADSVTSIEFEDTRANAKIMRGIKSDGIFKSAAGEFFTYTGKDQNTKEITGVTRSAKGSSAGTVTAGGTLHYIPHEIWMLYGNPGIAAPEQDEDLITEAGGVKTYDAQPQFNLSSSNNVTWDWDNFIDKLGIHNAIWNPKIIDMTGWASKFYYGNRGTLQVDPAQEMGIQLSSYLQNNLWRPANANIAWDFYTPVGFGTLIYSGEKYISTTNSWPLVNMMYGHFHDASTWDSQTVTTPSTGTWTAFAGTVASGTQEYFWRWRMRGGVSAVASNSTYAEVGDVTAYMPLARAPYVSMGAEQTNYQLDITIRNATTGEYMKISGPMYINDTLTVNCKNKTITTADGTNCINYLIRLSSVRDEWLTLSPGVSNSIVYTETSLAGMTITATYEERNL